MTYGPLIDDKWVHAHRARALSPDHPVLRGSAQNPDVFFQAREACNPFYSACPGIVQKTVDHFATLVGRRYHLFDYFGSRDAERVIVIMGSGAEAVSGDGGVSSRERRKGRRTEGEVIPALFSGTLY